MRARNVKPGFFQNENIAELPPETRLLFIGLWLMADREGRLEDRPKRIKMQVFPADSWDIEPMLSALHDSGLIVRYEVDSCKCIEIPKFSEHQRPHHQEKASVIPPRLEQVRTKERTASHQGTSQSALNPDTGYLNPDCLNPDPIADEFAAKFAEFKSTYPKRAGSQPWQNAEKAINARLREGHTWTEILEGAKRYAAFVVATSKWDTEFVQQAATFCGPKKGFLELWDPPRTKAESRQGKNIDAGLEFLRAGNG